MNYNVLQLQLSIPFDLDHVHAYAIGNTGSWYLVDAGMNTPAGRSAWQNFFQEHQIHPGHVKGIVITHHHPDHYGAAGWLQELCQAPVYMSAEDKKSAELAWKNWEQNVEKMKEIFRNNGAPEEILADLESDFSRLIPLLHPFPEVETVEDNSLLSADSFSLQILQTSGHTDGHLSILEPKTRSFFSGDHLLPDITTNIGLWAKTVSVDPLGDFIQSLEKISALDIQAVYPAHGAVFYNPLKRINEMLEHHHQRLRETRKFSVGGVTAYRISKGVFGENISPFENRLALAETLAHLNYLEYRGEVRSYDTGDIIIYDQLD